MKAPLSWLREYVPIEMTVEELSSRLALTGTEVERVTDVGVPGDEENLERFVHGKVLHCVRHPDADKLSVCTVDVGEGKLSDNCLRSSQRGHGPDRRCRLARRRNARWHSYPGCEAPWYPLIRDDPVGG